MALDYAKSDHLALICDGNGQVIKKPFIVYNSVEGVEFLIESVLASARRRKIPNDQIFFGGEDFPSYVENFGREIALRGFFLARVNAADAKLNRDNHVASTDCIDVIGISKTLLLRKARSAIDPLDKNDQIYRQIRDLMRTRSSIIKQRTATGNRIHTLVDQLLPGFLDSSKSGITPFTSICCELMKDRFSAPQISRRFPKAFAGVLRKGRVHHPEAKALKIIELAKTSLPPDPERIHALQSSLTANVELYECLTTNAEILYIEAAQLMAQTPYALLTSMGGFGLTLASGWAGELGDPQKLRKVDSLCCYGGIVPRTHQSGGANKPASHGTTSKRCNHYFKDWLLQASGKVALYGPDEWKQRHVSWLANNQDARFASAKRLIRTAKTLMKSQITWMDSRTRANESSNDLRARSAEETFNRLVLKWRVLPDWETLVFAEDRPLGFWRKLQIELYDANLPLPSEC